MPEVPSSDLQLIEVGPRDGLQNERVRLRVDQRVLLIDELVAAGYRHVEVGSFVSPRWIPQMADTAEVFKRLTLVDGVRYWALVPNRRGLADALEAGATDLALFVSSSETHNQRNLNRTIAESLDELRALAAEATAAGCRLRGYISTVFGCPWEGEVAMDQVLKIADAFAEMGVEQVSFGDTTGMGTPFQVRDRMQTLLERFPVPFVALHLHDTRGLAVTNALLAWEIGVRAFDGSIGGMGGCPYAAGASGNVGSEDLVHLFESIGVPTGIDLDRLLRLSRRLEVDWGATLRSRFYRYSQSRNDP